MATNPLIPLQGRVKDISGIFNNALLGVQRLSNIQRQAAEAPDRARILQAQAAGAEAAVPTQQQQFNKEDIARATSIVQGALQVNEIPKVADKINFLKNRRQSIIDSARTSGIAANTEETDLAISAYESGDIQGAQQLIDGSLNLGRQLGIIKTTAADKPQIKEGIIPAGQPGAGESGFFAVTPTSATQIPGIQPAARTPLVQIGAGGKEQEELAKLRAKSLTTLREKGDEAEQQIASLNILDNIDVSTGAAEPMKQAIAGFAEGFGIDASGLANIAAGQAFTAEAGKVVLRVLATQKGPQTDNDRANIAKTIKRLGNAPEANAFIGDAARATASRTIEQRDFFDNYLGQNDTLKGAASAWNKQKRDVPMVSQFVKTPEGLPVFFFRFDQRVRESNPDASKEQIMEAWKSQEQAARANK